MRRAKGSTPPNPCRPTARKPRKRLRLVGASMNSRADADGTFTVDIIAGDGPAGILTTATLCTDPRDRPKLSRGTIDEVCFRGSFGGDAPCFDFFGGSRARPTLL